MNSAILYIVDLGVWLNNIQIKSNKIKNKAALRNISSLECNSFLNVKFKGKVNNFTEALNIYYILYFIIKFCSYSIILY